MLDNAKNLKGLSILGSTGSIGTQALEVAKNLQIPVCGLAACKNVTLLEKQAREYKPLIVAVYDEDAAYKLKNALRDTKTKVVSGMEGLCEVACIKEASMILNSIVGMIGVYPTLAAIDAKKDIALANKETLVVAGELVMNAARKKNVRVLPVDSEHSAIFQCLQGCIDKNHLKKLILTASGGPFFGKKINDLKKVTSNQALNHPNWDMGAKITIDSATMMNKGLEIIEATWLFDMDQSNIDVLVHRESIVHSLIEYVDGSTIAQLGVPDMKIPIQYAFTYPQRVKSSVEHLDLAGLKTLSFYKPDEETFKCMKICRRAIAAGGTAPAIVNGANEEAVKLFLADMISFLDIGNIVEKAFEKIKSGPIKSIEDVTRADELARNFVRGDVDDI